MAPRIEVLGHCRDLAVAYILVLPVGWNQEWDERSADLRTCHLVAVASCGFVLAAEAVLSARITGRARILERLISGMRFLRGDAILTEGNRVHGTATAASLWTIGIAGGAVGYSLYDISFTLALVNFLTLRLLGPLKQHAASDVQP